MTNDLEQTNEALDVVDPMANVIDPVDSMVGTANPTPELANVQGIARPVFDQRTVDTSDMINGSNIDRQFAVKNNINNNTKQYG